MQPGSPPNSREMPRESFFVALLRREEATTEGWGCLENFSVGCPYLGGCFKHFVFSPLPGEDSHFDYYFSNGLKPPTSYTYIIIERCIYIYTYWYVWFGSTPTQDAINLDGLPTANSWALISTLNCFFGINEAKKFPKKCHLQEIIASLTNHHDLTR